MNVKLKFHFPIPELTLNTGYILAAVSAHRVEFSVEQGPKGLQATNVRPI
jgi:hypothetical protein